jgi:methylated-DNA-protein-cysteine methyltransferase-like protein
MVVFIVLTIIAMYPHIKMFCQSYQIIRKLTTRKTNKRKIGLNSINPSGKKDQSFFESVHQIARQIPYGKVTTYGAIAACLGTRLSARMVGWAMNAAHHAIPSVPAHRVVNRNGQLSGKNHFATPDTMKTLLESENIKVEQDTIIDFQRHFWNPQENLDQ